MTKLRFKDYTNKQAVLFPSSMDENIPANSPVCLLDQIIDNLDIKLFSDLYKSTGCRAYHPKMLLKIILYAYMNNIYSCRKIEELLTRDVHFIWLSGDQRPDFITINRFRNRMKTHINEVFTQLVLLLSENGFLSLDVAYIDGTKIESKANKYTFVWRKTVEKNKAKLLEKIKVLLGQIDDCIAQDNTFENNEVELTPELLSALSSKLKASLSAEEEQLTKRERQAKRKQIKNIEEAGAKLQEYNNHLEELGERNSYSKTDKSATFMRLKEDAMMNGQTKPAYNLQIATNEQFITDFSLYHNPTDTLTLIPFLNDYQAKYEQFPTTCVADAGYGSEENYMFLEANAIEPYVKYNYFHKEQRPRYQPKTFSVETLFYNKVEDCYICPMGQKMTYKGQRYRKSSSGYISETSCYQAQTCKQCPLNGVCFKGQGNRTIEVNYNLQRLKNKAKEKLLSEEGVKHRGKRCIEPEAVFGQMKYNMGYKRFRHRGQEKVNMDFAFFAIAFNIRKLSRKLLKMGQNSLITLLSPHNNVSPTLKSRNIEFFGKFSSIMVA